MYNLNTGVFGDHRQINQMLSGPPQNRIGQRGDPSQEGPSGSNRPLGGQNPESGASGVGHSARNSESTGASDRASDINAGAAAPPLDVEGGKALGRILCECLCPKCSTRQTPGLWGESWGNVYKLPLGHAWTNPENFPGSPVFSFGTDEDGSFGTRNISGVVFLDTSLSGSLKRKALVAYRMFDSGSAFQIRLHLFDCLPTSWKLLDSKDIELLETKDQYGSEFSHDSSLFWTDFGNLGRHRNRATLFSRQYAYIGSGEADTDTCNVWTMQVVGNEIVVRPKGEITVGLRKTMTAPSVCIHPQGLYMAKLMPDTSVLYGYGLQDSDPETASWQDLWQIDWTADAAFALGGSGTWAFSAGFSASAGSGLTNYSQPLRYRGAEPYWVMPVTGSYAEFQLLESRLLEMNLRAADGSIRFVTLWQGDRPQRGEILKLESSLNAWKDKRYQSPPFTYYTAGTVVTTSVHEFCGGSNVDFDRLLHTIDLGLCYVDQPIETHFDCGPSTVTYYRPYATGSSPLKTDETLEEVLEAVGFMPLRTPNDLHKSLAPYWRGAPPSSYGNAPNGHGVATPEGFRYYAALLPLPVFVPEVGVEFGEWGNNRGRAVDVSSERIGVKTELFGTCCYTTEQFVCFGLTPTTKVLYELAFFAVSPADDVTVLRPLERHVGVEFGAPDEPDPDKRYPASEAVPIPENCYAWIPIEELGIVCWLHDVREEWNKRPTPAITVTDSSLRSILYQIPSSELVPVDEFAVEETYDAPTGGVETFEGDDLNADFELSEPRVISIDSVLLNDVEQTEGWVFDDESSTLSFDLAPSDGVEVRIHFTYARTTVWAAAGDYQFLFHNLDNSGPLMKSYRRDLGNGRSEYILMVGLEYYSKTEPTDGVEGSTVDVVRFIRVRPGSYDLVHSYALLSEWQYPTRLRNSQSGPELIRGLAIGESIAYCGKDGSVNAIYEVK